MLIFDQFHRVRDAERFARVAARLSGLRSLVCRTRAEFDDYETFPWGVSFPAVLVDRGDLPGDRAMEKHLCDIAPIFDGRFAGT